MIKPCIECSQNFEFKTHNQKYCSPECCRTATNKRIMQKYYERKARLSGEIVSCKCGAQLSKYSTDKICSLCLSIDKKNKTNIALEALASAAKKAKS